MTKMTKEEAVYVLNLLKRQDLKINSAATEAIDMAIFALKKQEQTIKFIESRKQLHSSSAWYEFGIVKELDEVKRFVEKIQAEEDRWEN